MYIQSNSVNIEFFCRPTACVMKVLLDDTRPALYFLLSICLGVNY